MKPETLLKLINEDQETTFSLIDRYAAGEQGAYAIVDAEGHRLVMKWHPESSRIENYQAASQVTDLLRKFGYPAPQYILAGVLCGVSYSIQHALPGAPHEVTSTELAAHLVELNRLQVDRAVVEPRSWPARVVDTVLSGGDGYCLLDPLRNYSTTTAELLNVLQTLVTKHAGEEFQTNDIVHFDFNPANILVHEGTISGVIDWEGTCTGDCVFDLATLLFYQYDRQDLRELLWTEALERSGPGPLRVYLAHMILRQTDWSIRHHSSAIVQDYLRRAETVLLDIRG